MAFQSKELERYAQASQVSPEQRGIADFVQAAGEAPPTERDRMMAEARHAAMTHAPGEGAPAPIPVRTVADSARAAEVGRQQRAFDGLERRFPQGRARPGTPKDAEAMALGAISARGEEARQALRMGRVVSRGNVMHPLVQERGSSMRSALDVERQAMRDEHEARILQERRLASEAERHVREQGTQMAVNRATDRMHMEERRMELENQREIMAKITRAADAMEQRPDFDPVQYWKDQSLGTRFRAALQGGLFGLAGHRNPRQHIDNAIRMGMEAEKMSLQKGQAALGGRMQELQAQRGVYADLLAETQDERKADLLYEASMLEHGKRQMDSMRMSLGVPAMTAQQQQTAAQMDQRISEIQFQLGTMEATTPERISRFVPELQGFDREMAKEDVKAARALEMEGAKALIKRAGDSGKFDKDREEVIYKRMKDYSDKRESAVTLVRLIDEFKQKYKGEMPGVGRGAGYVGESAIAHSDLKGIREALGRMQSQGQIGPKELESFEDMIFGGFGEERLFANLDMIRKLGGIKMDEAERLVRGTAEGREAHSRFHGITQEAMPSQAPLIQGAGTARPIAGLIQE